MLILVKFFRSPAPKKETNNEAERDLKRRSKQRGHLLGIAKEGRGRLPRLLDRYQETAQTGDAVQLLGYFGFC